MAVRVYDMDAELTSTSKRLGEKVFQLKTTKFLNSLDYLQLSVDHEFPQTQTAQRIRVEVERMSGVPLKLWAMLSATNNETQHVTTSRRSRQSECCAAHAAPCCAFAG